MFTFFLFSFFPLFLFAFALFYFKKIIFCFCQWSEQTPKPAKNRREVPLVQRPDFLCENLNFGPRVTGEGVRSGPFESDFAFMFFISLFSLHFLIF